MFKYSSGMRSAGHICQSHREKQHDNDLTEIRNDPLAIVHWMRWVQGDNNAYI